MKSIKYFIGVIGFLMMSTAHADVEVEKGYVVEATFVSTAPIKVIWNTLTDYNNVDKFVSCVKKSTFIPPNTLKQRITGHWLFFRRTVDLNLRIKETLYNKIEFESISNDTGFSVYRGRWEIKDDNIVLISYTLFVKPNFPIPRRIISGVLKKQTRVYMKEVQAEIRRRGDARR